MVPDGRSSASLLQVLAGTDPMSVDGRAFTALAGSIVVAASEEDDVIEIRGSSLQREKSYIADAAPLGSFGPRSTKCLITDPPPILQ